VFQPDVAERSKIGSRGPGRPSRSEIYERLDAAIVEVRDRLGGLPSPVEARAIWDELWVHEAHNSTAIEGNTLVLREVEQLLLEGRAVGDRQLAEYMEVKGYADAARWVHGQALEPTLDQPEDLLTLTEIRHVHRMAMEPVWSVNPHPDAMPEESPGSFRRHDIQPFPGGMRPPSFALVEPKLRDWLDQVNAIPSAEGHLMERLARAHVGFEQVHPFLDGNGRTGRLLLNLILARLGYAPAIIQKRERPRYLQALRSADEGNDGPLAEPIARRPGQPLSLRRSGAGRPCAPRAARRAGDATRQPDRLAKRRTARPPTRPARRRWPVAQQPHLGRRVPREPVRAERDITRLWRRRAAVVPAERTGAPVAVCLQTDLPRPAASVRAAR
jgi:hypothetical protein